MDTIVRNYLLCAACEDARCSRCAVALETGAALNRVAASTGCKVGVIAAQARNEMRAYIRCAADMVGKPLA